MGIFKSKEKLYRLEVDGSYFSHSEGNLNLKELILKASENDPQLPIHKLVRSIDLGMLEMKADEYTFLEADNMELGHSLAIAKKRIEALESKLLELDETYTSSEYRQAWHEAVKDNRQWELDYFELQKELDSLSEAWSNEQKLRKQADEQVLELSRKLNSSKEREAEANFNAFEAYNEPMSVVQLLPQEVLKLRDTLRESETTSFYTGDAKWAEEVYKRNKNKLLDTALAELDIARCRVRDCTDTLNCHKYIALVELVDSLM